MQWWAESTDTRGWWGKELTHKHVWIKWDCPSFHLLKWVLGENQENQHTWIILQSIIKCVALKRKIKSKKTTLIRLVCNCVCKTLNVCLWSPATKSSLGAPLGAILHDLSTKQTDTSMRLHTQTDKNTYMHFSTQSGSLMKPCQFEANKGWKERGAAEWTV